MADKVQKQRKNRVLTYTATELKMTRDQRNAHKDSSRTQHSLTEIQGV